MKKSKGPILVFILIVILVLIAYYGKDYLFNQKTRDTSDTKGVKNVINWAGDGYIGYSYLRSVEMKKQLARKGIALKFNDDNGDYAQRLERFNDKEYDFIVLPINSYLEHGHKYKFPGVVVAGISESKGADAIVGFADIMPEGKVNDLNNPDLKIYYTPSSPSSFLLDLTISDFDLSELDANQNWRFEANGSEDVYQYAKKASKDRTVGDAFVMWEPEVSKAVNDLGMEVLWSSGKFEGYIIDVIVFHRDYVAKNPEHIKDVLSTYFRVINFYNSRTDENIKELEKISGLNKKTVENMIEGVDWYGLNENCSKLFDIPVAVGMPSRDGLINSIYACSDVMRRVGTIDEEIDDPYSIINSTFIEELNEEEIKSPSGTGSMENQTFSVLSEKEWKKLTEIGTMRVKPITFQSGTNTLDFQGEEIVDKVATMLVTNYPGYRVEIRGHTGSGDEKANLELSQKRADIVRQRLIAVHSIDPNRINARGMGATQPPRKKNGENPRSYMLRWARVEFVLLDNSN